MSDVIPPPELIGLKREFLDLEEAVAAAARSHPSPTAVAADEAELTEAQRETWERLSKQRTDLACRIQGHEAFDGLSLQDRLAMDTAATKAAKAAPA